MIARSVAPALQAALLDTPAVMVIGPRQSGKSTLVQSTGDERQYVSLDDPLELSRARKNPGEFLDSFSGPVTIDEVQRAPDLMLALKLRIDRNRQPGRFLLTGSANVLVLPKVAESLAGRMEVIELLPLTQAEIEGSASQFFKRAFGEGWESRHKMAPMDLFPRLVRGGFPEPVQRVDAARRQAWFGSYLRTLIERDVRDLGNIEGLTEMPRLLQVLATEVGSALNIDAISRKSGIPATTLRRYLDLLKALFLVQTVPAWTMTSAVRLAKTSKAYLLDTALLAYLRGWLIGDEPGLTSDGAAVENFVANELGRLIVASGLGLRLYHFRTVRQKEVPFLVEAPDGRLIGMRLSLEKNLSQAEDEGLDYLREIVPDRFVRGVILYGGDEVRTISENLVAVPYSALWG